MSSPSPSSSLSAASQAFLAQFFPPTAPLQRDIPIDLGRVNMETATRKFGGPLPSVRRIDNLSVPCLGDLSADVKIRVYWPLVEQEKKLPVVLYAHGGGWVKGNLNTHDNLCRRLAIGSGQVVVAVDYRLSPESRYPDALDDLEAAFKWVGGQPTLDSTQVTVAGDSAGGNLVSALVVRLLTKKDGEVKPDHQVKRQVLIYPIVDMRMEGESYEKYGAGFGLSEVSIQYYIEMYLGRSYTDALVTNPEVSPILFGQPEMMPTTMIVTAECDPLASEAGALRERLEAAGVSVKHVVYPGTVHAYLTYFDLFPESEISVEEIVGWLKKETLAVGVQGGV